MQDIVAIHGDQITQSDRTLAYGLIKPCIQLGGKPDQATLIPIFCDTSHLADALVGCASMYRHVLMSVVSCNPLFIDLPLCVCVCVCVCARACVRGTHGCLSALVHSHF